MSAPDSSKCVANECLLCRARHNRHAYATHQLENGLPIHQLQKFLGHSDIHLTLRYLHWLPESHVMASDLLAHFTPDDAILNSHVKESSNGKF